jgi:hypothetical protein
LDNIRKKIILVWLRDQNRLLLLHLRLGPDVSCRFRDVVVGLSLQSLMMLLLECLLIKFVLEL